MMQWGNMTVAMPFKVLYMESGPDGETLDWEWDPEKLVFEATTVGGRTYTIKPLSAVMTDDAEETEDEETEE